MKAISRIRETRRKKKAKLTFKSSSKRGCSYGDSASQNNMQDVISPDVFQNTNGEISISPIGQSTYKGKSGRLYVYLILKPYLLLKPFIGMT